MEESALCIRQQNADLARAIRDMPRGGEKNTETRIGKTSASNMPNLCVEQYEWCDSVILHSTCGTNEARRGKYSHVCTTLCLT